MSVARDYRRHARTVASQENAQMIYNVLRQEPTPRDAAATLAAVHAALIWEVEQEDETQARKMAQEMVEGIVTLWKEANKAAVDAANKKALQ